MADSRVEKWRRWIDGPIRTDVLTMHLQRDAWGKVSAMLAEHQGNLPESYWWEFMVDTYITTQAVAVRRQADRDPRAASLAKLIEQTGEDAARITRDWWISLWDSADDPFSRTMAERQWAENFGGEVGVHLDPALVAGDLDGLKTAAADVKRFVAKHLAHTDARAVGADVVLTVREVHNAVGHIGDVFRRYYSLLTASSYAMLVPAIQHNWLAIFHQPWMRPDSKVTI